MRNVTKPWGEQWWRWMLLLALLLALSPQAVTGQAAAGSLIAYVGSDGNVWVVQEEGSGSRQLTNDAGGADDASYCCLRWSPDGQWLAYQRTAGAWPAIETQLWLHDVTSGTARPLLTEMGISGYDWMPDGTAIVYGRPIPEVYWTTPEGTPVAVDGLWQVDVTSGATTAFLPPFAGQPLIRPRWARGGGLLGMRAVAYLEGSQPFVTYAAASGEVTYWEQVVGSASLAPDGAFLVYDRIGYVEPGPGLVRLDRPGGAERSLTTAGDTFSDGAPQVAPDGTLVAFLRGPLDPESGFALSSTLWVVPAGGGAPRQVSDVAASDEYDWAPDSRRLVVTQREGAVPQLSIVALDGSAARLLAQGSGAAWQPLAETTAVTATTVATKTAVATATAPLVAEATPLPDEPAPTADVVATPVTATASATPVAAEAESDGDSSGGAEGGGGGEAESGVDGLLPDALVDAGRGPAALIVALLGAGLLLGGVGWAWRGRGAAPQEPVCPRCGYPVTEHATFCGNCGQVLATTPAAGVGRMMPGVVIAAAGLLLLLLAFVAQQAGAEEASEARPTPETVVVATATETAPPTAATTEIAAATATVPPPEATTTVTATPAATETPALPPTITPTPGHGDRFVLGYSANGTPLEAVRAGTGPNVIVFVGGLHAGFAPGSVDLAQRAARYLSDTPGVVPETATVYVVLSANPDSTYNPGFLPGRMNARYVDLNRNWPCLWTRNPRIDGDVVPGAGGEAALSEPEAQALADFFMAQQPRAVVVWDARAADGLVFPGVCGDGSRVSQPLAVTYARGAGFYWENYETFSGQAVPGDVTNWLDQQGIPAAYVLLRSFTDAGWERNRPALLAVIDAYGR